MAEKGKKWENDTKTLPPDMGPKKQHFGEFPSPQNIYGIYLLKYSTQNCIC